MSHTKIIQSGTLVEVYRYERDPPQVVRKKKRRFFNPRRRVKNLHRARTSFFRLVRANVSPTSRPALVTLTMREVVSIGQGWRVFTLFAQRLRKRSEGKISFIAVPEFQKRGAVHFHVLIWGFSDDEIATERYTRSLARLWGYGFLDIRATDGNERLVGYLAKYMSKAMYDPRLAGRKSYSASRNTVRSVSLSTPTQIDVAQRVLGLGVDIQPLTEKTYQTKWMGKCDYKVYKI